MAVKSISVRLEGMDEFLSKLQAFGKGVVKGVEAALYQEAQLIMGRSKREFVPVDTGALRASGHVKRPEWHGSNVTVEMGYGGPSAEYALMVHEDLSTPHEVGSAKYLETPFLEAESGMLVRIAERIEKERIGIKASTWKAGTVKPKATEWQGPVMPGQEMDWEMDF